MKSEYIVSKVDILQQREFLLIAVECSSYVTGDGSGGPETSEGSMSSDKACTDRCIQVQKTKPDIVGATVSTDGQHRCYCEYKMDGTTGSTSYKACGLLSEFLNSLDLFSLFKKNLIWLSCAET